MKIRYQDLDGLIGALHTIGGTFTKIINHGGTEEAAQVPYKYGAKSAEIRRAAARNLRSLTPYAEEFTKVKNGLLAEVTDGRGTIERHEQQLMAKYNKQLNELQEKELDPQPLLIPINEADLDLDKNPIPPGVLAALASIEAPKAEPQGDS
jgi:hypothetical protein